MRVVNSFNTGLLSQLGLLQSQLKFSVFTTYPLGIRIRPRKSGGEMLVTTDLIEIQFHRDRAGPG
jgi:hypothetical protein